MNAPKTHFTLSTFPRFGTAGPSPVALPFANLVSQVRNWGDHGKKKDGAIAKAMDVLGVSISEKPRFDAARSRAEAARLRANSQPSNRKTRPQPHPSHCKKPRSSE